MGRRDDAASLGDLRQKGIGPEAAAEVLKHKQFLAAREEAPAFAAQPDFYKHLLATFEAMAPFVAFLNEPIVEMRRHLDRDPLLGTAAMQTEHVPVSTHELDPLVRGDARQRAARPAHQVE